MEREGWKEKNKSKKQNVFLKPNLGNPNVHPAESVQHPVLQSINVLLPCRTPVLNRNIFVMGRNLVDGPRLKISGLGAKEKVV